MTVTARYHEKIIGLQLAAKSPKYKGKTFVLVEGDDDKKLYKHFFNETYSEIEVMNGSHFVAQGLIDLKNAQFLVVGIRDADFMHLENTPSPLPNLFLTDFHDAEMLMAANDSAFAKIAGEYQIEKTGLREKLLHSIRFLAYFRWYNMA